MFWLFSFVSPRTTVKFNYCSNLKLRRICVARRRIEIVRPMEIFKIFKLGTGSKCLKTAVLQVGALFSNVGGQSEVFTWVHRQWRGEGGGIASSRKKCHSREWWTTRGELKKKKWAVLVDQHHCVLGTTSRVASLNSPFSFATFSIPVSGARTSSPCPLLRNTVSWYRTAGPHPSVLYTFCWMSEGERNISPLSTDYGKGSLFLSTSVVGH